MLFKETDIGTIHYRLPNSEEVPRVLGLCKINSKRLADREWMDDNEMFIMADLIGLIHRFITQVDIEVDGKKIENAIELKEIPALRKALYDIAKEVMESLPPIDEKKKA